MHDEALLRYSRHILLDDIGITGQERILAGHALVIGAGGLGSPVAMYLAAAGLGTITVTDHDTVDLTNLQRQIAHRTASVGSPKVESLKHTLHELNPLIRVNALQIRADAQSLDALVQAADVVLDCSDNFKTRHAVNAACVRHGKPLVSGAAIQFDGQINVPWSGPRSACRAIRTARSALRVRQGLKKQWFLGVKFPLDSGLAVRLSTELHKFHQWHHQLLHPLLR